MDALNKDIVDRLVLFGSQIIFLARSIDLSSTIERLEIAHTDIVQCSPTKTSALFDALAVQKDILPKARSKASAIDKALARRHPLKILLVDDDAVNLLVGTKVLERFGYTGVVMAADGQLALQACERERFSLVLMDLAMPVSPLPGRSASLPYSDLPYRPSS